MKLEKSHKRIIFLVSNDLVTDNRMHRICTSLAANNFSVELLGRQLEHSKSIGQTKFLPTRLKLIFNKGFLFYAELNIRFFIYLMLNVFDVVCACDADTLPAAVLAGKLKRKKIVFDAHEYFSEVPELVNRRWVYKFWQQVEHFFIPKVDVAYTVNDALAQLFEKKFKVKFEVIRNLPLRNQALQPNTIGKYILYQGAVNMGRGVKEMILAMQFIDEMPFYIAGTGDEYQTIKELIVHYKLENKVKLLGLKTPQELREITQQAYMGINLLEQRGLNYYYSLSNKFFDYIQAGVPQVCIAFPEYIKYNKQYSVAVLVERMVVDDIVKSIKTLIDDKALYVKLKQNCIKAAIELNWEQDESKLVSLYSKL